MKHHYVPEFHLKNWCNNKGQLIAWRNVNGKIVSKLNATPGGFGYKPFLYSYHEDFETADRHEIETSFFQKVDDRCAKIMFKLLNSQSLTADDRVQWAYFILLYRLRTPETVDWIKSEWEKQVSKDFGEAEDEYVAVKSAADPETLFEWVDGEQPGYVESLAVAQIPAIAKSDKALKDILAFRWCIFHRSGAGRALLCSDRPLVWSSLASEQCVLALPLSPTHVFLAFRKQSPMEQFVASQSPQLLYEETNRMVVSNADEFVFSQAVGDVSPRFLQNYLKQR